VQAWWSSVSPFARKVRVTLFEKRVPFEAIEVTSASQREALRTVNPRAEVPALVDGGLTVTGSREICDYLEARFPEPPLVPSEPRLYARVIELERLSDSHSDGLQFLLHLVAERRPELGERFPKLRGALEGAVESHFAWLDSELVHGDWFAGAFSRADIALATQVTTLIATRGARPTHSRLSAWLTRALSRDSVRRDLAEAQAAYEKSAHEPEPFFATHSIHWRDTRIEMALRFGLGEWLAEELRAGRAFLPPEPG